MDPRWLDALKLPARIIVGWFLASALVLVLDYFGVVRLAEFHALARPITIICAVVSGSLSLAAFGGLIYDRIQQRRKPELLAQRRRIRRAEEIIVEPNFGSRLSNASTICPRERSLTWPTA